MHCLELMIYRTKNTETMAKSNFNFDFRILYFKFDFSIFFGSVAVIQIIGSFLYPF